jgi:hypothetical protein
VKLCLYVIFFSRNLKIVAIGLCIDSLPPEMKSYYQDFALFAEDVNIKPEVKLLFFSALVYRHLSLVTNI